MKERAILREISEIFTFPENFTIHLLDRSISLDSSNIVTRRSSDQIEFWIRGDGNSDSVELITLPMSVDRVERCRLLELHISSLKVDVMTPYSVECVKFSQTDNPSRSILTDIVIQRLPEGLTLAEWSVAWGQRRENTLSIKPSIEEIYCAITLLDQTLRRLNIYFKGSRGISPDSIVVGEDGLLYPTHYANMRIGRHSGQRSECDILRQWLETMSGVKQDVGDGDNKKKRYPIRLAEPLAGHLSVGLLIEGRAMIEEPTGWGFVDADNRIVVAPYYRYITNFSEGRAVVQSERGWGLIDLNGVEIIPSIYESIGYNVATGISSVRQGDRWGYFSYMGEQLTPISIDYPNEDITHAEIADMMVVEESL